MADRTYPFDIRLPATPSGDTNEDIRVLFNAVHGLAVLLAGTSGFAAPTGTATLTTFDTATVTTAQLAERVKALLDYLMSQGTI